MELMYVEFFSTLLDNISIRDVLKLRILSKRMKRLMDHDTTLKALSKMYIGTPFYISRGELFSNLSFWHRFYKKYNLRREEFKHGIKEEFTFDCQLMRSALQSTIAVSFYRGVYYIYRQKKSLLNTKAHLPFHPLNYTNITSDSKSMIEKFYSQRSFLSTVLGLPKGKCAAPEDLKVILYPNLGCCLGIFRWKIDWKDFQTIRKRLEDDNCFDFSFDSSTYIVLNQ